MSFLLDTDICSAFIKQNRKVFNRFLQHSGGLHTSRIVLAELYDWAYGRPTTAERWEAIDVLLDDVSVIEFDDACARTCGELRYELRTRGIKIPDMDALIGASALVHDMTLVTHNTKDFEGIPGLRLTDWLA